MILPKSWLRLAAIIAIVLVSACQNEQSASDAQPTLFPLNKDWQWTYSVRTQIGSRITRDELRVSNLGIEHWPDDQTVSIRQNSLGNRYAIAVDATGVRRVASQGPLRRQWYVDPEQPARFVLRNPISPGTYWQLESVPYLVLEKFDMPRQLRRGRAVLMGYQVLGINEGVKVPAGQFENCVHVQGRGLLQVYSDGLEGKRDIPVTQDEWFCPGTGLVKLERNEPVTSPHYEGGKKTFELLRLQRIRS